MEKIVKDLRDRLPEHLRHELEKMDNITDRKEIVQQEGCNEVKKPTNNRNL